MNTTLAPTNHFSAPRRLAMLVALCCSLGLTASAAHAKGKKAPRRLPTACAGGTFRLAGPSNESLVLDSPQVALADCPATTAVVRTTRRGTTLRAKWAACAAATKVTIRFQPDCDHLKATIVRRTPRTVRAKVQAVRARCGDGIRDAALGEQCDPDGCGGDAVCAVASCTCTRPVSTTYDVTYTDETTVIGQDVVTSHFRRQDGTQFVFTRGTAVDALTPGRVAIFAGLALRRVAGVQIVGDETIVETTNARLTDAIHAGTIAWDAPVRFDAETAGRAIALQGGSVALGDSGERMTLSAGRAALSYDYSGTIKGVDVSLQLTPSLGRLAIEGTMTYGNDSASGFTATASGRIQGLRALGRIGITDGQVDDLSMEAADVSGELRLKVTALRLSTDGFKLPIPLAFPIPLQVGPVPVLITLRANASIVPVLEGEASSDLEFKVTFNTSQGVRLEGGQPKPFGQLRNEGISLEKAITAGFVPVGIGFGLEFPRLEIGIFGNAAVSYLTMVTSVQGYFTPNLRAPCLDGGASIRGVVGYSLGFFGISSSAETELFKQSRFTRRQGQNTATGRCP